MLEKVVALSPVLQRLLHYGETTFPMFKADGLTNKLHYDFDISIVRYLFSSIDKGTTLYDNPNSLFHVVRIAAYLGFTEETLARLLSGRIPSCDMIPQMLGFFYQLHSYGYPILAELYIRNAKLPLKMIEDPNIPYHKFKKICRDAHNLEELLAKRKRPGCACPKCTQHRQERDQPTAYRPQLRLPGRIQMFPQQTALPAYMALLQSKTTSTQGTSQQ